MDAFPCAIAIAIPFPTHRLASTAQRALTVDKELSAQVRRSISISMLSSSSTSTLSTNANFDEVAVTVAETSPVKNKEEHNEDGEAVAGVAVAGVVAAAAAAAAETEVSSAPLSMPTNLVVEYTAATNRLLRVAVNGFFDSLRVVLHTMQELDLDTINIPNTEALIGVQGIEMEDK